MKCVENLERNTGGKAAPRTKTDAQVRKAWGANRIDTLVIHAVNDVDLGGCALEAWLPGANALKSTAWGARPQG